MQVFCITAPAMALTASFSSILALQVWRVAGAVMPPDTELPADSCIKLAEDTGPRLPIASQGLTGCCLCIIVAELSVEHGPGLAAQL